MKYDGKQIGVLGCGASGLAAARLAASLGAGVCVLDSGAGARVEATAATLASEGIEFVGGEDAERCGRGFDQVVVSPGIDPSWAIATQFEGTGSVLVSEIEFGFQNTALPVVAVTGTNGKTTTTELVAAALCAGGLRTVACGNHGRALCDVVMRDGGALDVLTVEVSSFQLELIDTFRPAVAVWMNFAADHLDRHPSVEAYRAAKLRVFENQGAADLAVVKAEEALPAPVAETVTFSGFGGGGDYGFEDGAIVRGGDVLVELSATRLRGRHNAENVMAAWAVARRLGVEDAVVRGAVESYEPPAHRCELVATAAGVDFVNDSKATNLHALESALRSLDGTVVLIAGGKQKGLDYTPLTNLVAERAKKVFLIGEIGEELAAAWGAAVECEVSRGLDEAVAGAAGAAGEGDVVLFSPGTSSFDMYSGYVERGEAFREAVRKLS